jgi:hypothetical protein
MASNNPSNFNATGFNRSIRRTVELKGGKCRDLVQLASGDLYHEDGKYDLVSGGGLPQEITNRFPDSPTSESDYSVRTVSRKDYNDGQYMDRADLDRMVVDPRAEKSDVLLQKFRRLEDLTIQSAMLGSAQGGDTGTSATAFTAGNIIDVTLGAASGFTNAGFTYEKLTAAIQAMQDNGVDLDYQRPCIQIAPAQMNDILQQDKFINKDYINNAVVSGGWKIPNYMGCDWVVTNILPYMNTAATGFNIDLATDVDTTNAIKGKRGVWADTDTTDVRAAIMTVKDATLFEIKPDIVTRATERSDKSFRWYTYIEMGLGAVRMEEEKIFVIPSDQSPAAA